MTVQLPAGLPVRILDLPRDKRGFPIPWFVTIRDGEPDFQLVARERIALAEKKGVCWVCGGPRGRNLAFAIGTLNTVTRVSAEPASHLECAQAAARICPFLVRPQMKRAPTPEGAGQAGLLNERNPGVTAVWVTRHYGRERNGLFILGQAERIEWWREGRAATLQEVATSLAEVIPGVRASAEADGERAMRALLTQIQALLPLMPKGEDEGGPISPEVAMLAGAAPA